MSDSTSLAKVMIEAHGVDVRIEGTEITDLLAEFRALTPEVDAAKRGTTHETHKGWSLGGDPYLARCSCGTPLDDILSVVTLRDRHPGEGPPAGP